MWLQCLPFLLQLNASNLLPDCDKIIYTNGVPVPAFPPDDVYPCLPISAYETGMLDRFIKLQITSDWRYACKCRSAIRSHGLPLSAEVRSVQV